MPCPLGSVLVATWRGDGTLQAGRRAETLSEACMHLGLCSSRNTHQQGSPNAGVNPIRAHQHKGQCSGSPCGTIPKGLGLQSAPLSATFLGSCPLACAGPTQSSRAATPGTLTWILTPECVRGEGATYARGLTGTGYSDGSKLERGQGKHMGTAQSPGQGWWLQGLRAAQRPAVTFFSDLSH